MNVFLFIGAALSGIAALLHVGCIIYGAPWYRFFGAGERMASLAEAGSLRPAIVTACIVGLLLLASVYALSAAGALPALPIVKPVVLFITGVYLVRGLVGFLFVRSAAFGNSAAFWFWSSAICLILGLFHLVGVLQVWSATSVAG